MYFTDQSRMLRRLRSQEAFPEGDWVQTPAGLILHVPHQDGKEVEGGPESGWVELSSGFVVPASAIPKVTRKPTAVSLFTGAGGFDLGFRQAGWRVLAATDHDTSCAWTYGYNLGARPMQFHFLSPEDRERFLDQVVGKATVADGLVEIDDQDRVLFHRSQHYRGPDEIEDGTPHYFLGDVRKLTGAMILSALGLQVGEVDCVMGGPPCQGFSVVGKRDVMDPRNSLVFEFAKLILQIRPRTFVFENVPGILSMVTPEGIPVMDAFCHTLSDDGYASYDALKKGLEHNLKAWGVVRDQGGSKARAKKEAQPGVPAAWDDEAEDQQEGAGAEQLHLFGG